ncbi:hypothetical protein AALO_G00146430 [Alosa alosa]|uniref:Vacuolar fusion protein MON1 homolog n=1 Tax=Alosa alosa TaxID=278164 RepID=A0AAV6GJF1_9TELE|nr:hypothetical protein AALO_G00146430 [Alosa alosa]
MAADVHSQPWESSNGSLSVERLRTDRADSPTPGLVEGTEPGAGGQMFVTTQSFEDLTADTEERAEPECPEGEGLRLEEGAEEEEELHQEEGAEPGREKDEDVSSEAWRSHRKHVFVLSEAGKPIWSRYGTEEALSSTMGRVAGRRSRAKFPWRCGRVVLAANRSLQRARELALRVPGSWSLLTLAQLQRLFQSKQNYDLRRLLSA